MVTVWNSHTVTVKQSTINSPHIKLSMRSDLKTSKLAHYLADVTGSSTVKSVRSSFDMFICTAIYGSFRVLFLSIYKIHIIIEMLCIDNIDFFDQRCAVRGIALSSLLSCQLPTYLNSHGSPVAPTWAHLCWPRSRSVHGSIHSCVIGRPCFASRGHPKWCLRSRRLPSVNES